MAYRWNPQPLTCRVYIMRKGLQRGVSQRHRVVMTCQTIIHYHQLEIQQWIATANFGSPKAPVFAPKVIMWRSSQKKFYWEGALPPPQTHPPVRRRTPFPTPHSPRRLRGLEALDSCACSVQPRYVPHPITFYTPKSSFSRNMPGYTLVALVYCIAYNSRLYGITYSVLIVGLRLIIHICKCYIDVL